MIVPLLLAVLCADVIFATPAIYVDEKLNAANSDLGYKKEEPLPEVTHPDAILTSVQLMNKYGYYGEAHRVVTEDNYILELHRNAGPRNVPRVNDKPVILLMHGLLGDSSNWIISGPENALAYVLADAGYDVWLGNARGSTYSRKHKTMTVRDPDYWMFSWHEIGVRDLPAMIDYILKHTNKEKLFYIGHSQGSTAFFVMASERPAYQDKVEAMFALGPVAYCARNPNPFAQILAKFEKKLHLLTKLIGMYEFEPTNELLRDLAAIMCDERDIIQPLCNNILFLIAGYSDDQLNKTLVPIIVGHSPSGASTRQFVHYAQLLNSGRFRQYDHGLVKNLKIYKKVFPPSYDLKNNRVPTYFHYSTNDRLVNVRDVHQTYGELGNPKGKFRVPHDEFNHLDFLWGNDVKRFVYDKILSLLSRHN